MIPKVIRYCWFGGKPLPLYAIKCIESWRKFFPDYVIKEWNESNFNVDIIPYTHEAYQASKYAFVSDYARFWILYNYGGVYFDTDVEVVKDMRDLIARGNYLGKEAGVPLFRFGKNFTCINPGLGMAVSPKNDLLKAALDIYAASHFINDDGTFNTKTIVTITTELLIDRGYLSQEGMQEIDGWYLYPEDFFCPKNYYTGECLLTNNTYSIHHYDASWKTKKEKLKKRIIKILGRDITLMLVKIKHLL